MVIDLYTWLIFSALAAFRISEILVIDSGPFGIFEYMRGWVLLPYRLLYNIGSILNCVHCAGVYVSALLVLGYFFQNIYIFAIIFIFAIAGLQSILSKCFGRSG